MEHERDMHGEQDQPLPAAPGHEVAIAWDKSDGDAQKMRPKPPVWVGFMDRRRKEFCKG